MNLTQAYYEERFENAFLRAKGDEFQTFFERLMGLAYRADFMACRPWGKQGDHKNDGFLKSERRLFQVYAPNEMKATEAIAKIKEDFEGARAYWGRLFDHWVFAHNGVDGLPAHVQKILLDFETKYKGITLEPWGLEEFRTVFRLIDIEDLRPWLGAAPSEETKARVGFQDLQIVLESIAGHAEPVVGSVRDVPMGKIEANALSPSIATLLKVGMSKAPLVEGFFAQFHDASLGERVADAFKAKYASLRGAAAPNGIFHELQQWAGGSELPTPEHQLAVLTVISYFFERCDIFEEPRGVAK